MVSVQPVASSQKRPPAWLALGFRPFFIGAALSALILILIWLAMWRGLLPPNAYFNLTEWHAHEMLFGYTAAVVAGFLLTAVRNWTGMAVPVGGQLGGLFGLWLLARLLISWPVLPHYLIALVDLAFFPALAYSLWSPLWNGPNPVNRYFLLFFALMSLANLLTHMDALNIVPGLWPRGIYLMIDSVLLVLLLISGRVIPFFAERALPGAQPKRNPWIERISFASLSLALISSLFFPYHAISAILWLIVALVQMIRWLGWYPKVSGLWQQPILWILYLGYAWLIIGALLRGLSGLDMINRPAIIHALTIGTIGVMSLGMMSRVALGHTGRNINAINRSMVLAFILLNLSALIRVFMPVFDPAHYSFWIELSGLCWLLSFILFLFRYFPLLIRPRPDGRPG